MNKLLFFNKEGYAYNFEKNIDGYYQGKILFDENSSDTFKTLGMYIFEEIPSSEMLYEDLTLINQEFYDYSGITIQGNTNIDPLTIKNITKVNDGPYYSKWIIGDNFHTLFPKGSIISFTGLTTSNFSNPLDYNDFTNNYYTVLETKPNSILILTQTINTSYTSTYISGETSSIYANNIISYTDYDNYYSTYSNLNSLNLYENQSISINNESFENNNGIFHIKDYNVGKKYYQEYNLSGLTSGDTLRFEVELLTERPKIYNGSINAVFSGTTVYVEFTRGLNSFFGKKRKELNIKIGEEIIFEDFNDQSLFNNQIFTIEDIVSETDLGNFTITKIRREIDYDKTLNNLINDKRYRNLGSVSRSDIENYVIPSSPNNLRVYNNYIEISGLTYFRNNDIIELSGNYKNNKKVFTILEQEDLSEYLTRLYVDNIVIYENNVNYNVFRKLEKYEQKTIICSVSSTASDYNGNSVVYLTSNKLNYTQEFLNNVENTITSFNNRYYNDLLNRGIVSYYYDDKWVLESRYTNYNNESYFNINLYNNNVFFSGNTINEIGNYFINVKESLSNYESYRYEESKISKKSYSIIDFNLQNNSNNYGFRLKFNELDTFINFDTNTSTTLNNYVNSYLNDSGTTYYELFYQHGFILSTSGDTLKIEARFPNLTIWDLEIQVNSFSTYNIVSLQDNQGTLLTTTELDTSLSNFYDQNLSTGMIVGIKSYEILNNKNFNIIGIPTNKILELSYQGHIFLNTDGFENSNVFSLIEVLENSTLYNEKFLRKPRKSYNKNYRFVCKWTDDEDESIFFYDFTGNQPNLKYGPIDKITGNRIEELKYDGKKPLFQIDEFNPIYLQKEPNLEPNLTDNPKYQQTIFPEVEYDLDQLDSENINYLPEPIEIFVGYNSNNEGVNYRNLIIEEVEDTVFSGTTNNYLNNNGIQFIINNDGWINYFNNFNNSNNFIDYGFEPGQLIKIDFFDLRPTGQTIFTNQEIYTIESVTKNGIKININDDLTWNEFYTTGNTYGYNFSITVKPKKILDCVLYGETETEDERYRIHLRNLGITINDDIEYIFKESDIQEEGIDYKLLNNKRKEMLSNFTEIYNYIGSYKALINAINFFGYNDLELYEYYRNINPNSPLYQKLSRVRIPDIFDNSVPGWSDDNFFKDLENKNNYKKTKLFNLTYRITDENGNNILMYSSDEAQKKLMGLKKWLQDNVVPISTNIVDVTGVVDVKNTLTLKHDTSYNVHIIHNNSKSNVINFYFEETQNFENDYLITIHFYTLGDNFNPENGWSCKVKTFSKDENNVLHPEKYFKLYKTDMDPFQLTINKKVDPYIYIEATYYNEYGNGITIRTMQDMKIMRNYYLINNNFEIYDNGLKYLNLPDDYYYFFNKNGDIVLYGPRIRKNYPPELI